MSKTGSPLLYFYKRFDALEIVAATGKLALIKIVHTKYKTISKIAVYFFDESTIDKKCSVNPHAVGITGVSETI